MSRQLVLPDVDRLIDRYTFDFYPTPMSTSRRSDTALLNVWLKDGTHFAYSTAFDPLPLGLFAELTRMLDFEPKRVTGRKVCFMYTNWKGVRSLRTVTPDRVYFGRTEYQPDLQWLLVAFDHDKDANRTFAMSAIEDWRATE